MQILFIHGMGRTPLSGAPMLFYLRKNGYCTETFGYFAAIADFNTIRDRLSTKIAHIAAQGDYILIGHSLGGVLLRSALSELSATIKLPTHVFLLGSPVSASRMAKKLSERLLFRLLTGDCGQLLSSEERMAKIASLSVPNTSIVGIKGINGNYSPFLEEPNDGIVAVSEVSAQWIEEEIRVPVMHTFLPSDAVVSNALIRVLNEKISISA
jgi:pimeloyl-ACP methyl ester carboxylesterase